MTQQEKYLLLKDLCARLPYGVIGVNEYRRQSNLLVEGKAEFDILTSIKYRVNKFGWKPYLRPMSSMTEEERNDFYHNRTFHDGRMWESEGADVDWLNAHHFDYRGLIAKGLALEAKESMYNYLLEKKRQE